MDQNDEKFFEQLAQKRAEHEQKFEVQLARAKTVAPKLVPPAKILEERSEDLMEGTLTIDVYQTNDSIIVESAIAGVRPDDLDITATNESVTIKGERKRNKEISDDSYFYQECFWGRFSRSVILPQEVDPEGAEVAYQNGILSVKLPKINRQKTKKLNIRIS